ncbi:hypothetical protein PENANT_c019G10597 [Penicillium antarcticum]|uniref:Uncharacterized protein n=1 Tax=Penicillium antarcticum TaxID=416450 RepID=A0A1V6Q0T6_9EURO|nr:hypothetical protein PENANT_c019G10597 [Penicillium antarcticum]
MAPTNIVLMNMNMSLSARSRPDNYDNPKREELLGRYLFGWALVALVIVFLAVVRIDKPPRDRASHASPQMESRRPSTQFASRLWRFFNFSLKAIVTSNPSLALHPEWRPASCCNLARAS